MKKDSGVKNRYFNVDLIKTIAVFLIINSHMDPIYKHGFLATGGALGNSLFFITSGFLLYGKKKNIIFYLKSFIKLYIPYYIVCLININQLHIGSIRQGVETLIWPTSYWFLGAIIVFYMLFGLAEYVGVYKRIGLFTVFTVIMYTLAYLRLDTSKWVVESVGLTTYDGVFKLIYYFYIMILGGLCKRDSIEKTFSNMYHKSNKNAYRAIWILSLCLFLFTKILLTENSLIMRMQFLTQFFAVIFSYSILKDSFYLKLNNKVLLRIIVFVSSISLECYLVQFNIIEFMASHVDYPFNVAVAIISIFISGYILKMLAELIEKIIYKILGF